MSEEMPTNLGEMFITDDDGHSWQFTLNTDPPQAMYWSTYRIKLSHIKVKAPDRTKAAEIRKLIFNDLEDERNAAFQPSSKNDTVYIK
tara:strand:- start:93 stop:356 length:264 start_codon:yes stop_codon:yes gene_type:complete